MAMREEEIVEVLSRENEVFRGIYQIHRALDCQLSEFTRKSYLTPEEEAEMQRIKKEKLYKKDKIAEFIRDYKRQHAMTV